MMDGVSVIICCYNSARRLPETLGHLANQKTSENLNWEIIVVNNNSTDNTREIAAEYWKQLACRTPFCIVDEQNPGLSNARKKGAFSARYSFLIFCDDDNWLDENYVEIVYNVMKSNPQIGILGGNSEAVFEEPPPAWFRSHENDYAVGKQGSVSGDATSRRNLWGAGMAIRTALFIFLNNKGLNGFLKDRKGNNLSAGGDNEICKWYILAGYKLWYENRLLLKHFIPKERLTESYFNRMWEGFRETDYWLGRYDILIHIKNEHNSRLRNFSKGLKYLLLRRENVFVIKGIDLTRTYIQFLIGPLFKVSTKEEFRLVKIMYPFLYGNL